MDVKNGLLSASASRRSFLKGMAVAGAASAAAACSGNSGNDLLIPGGGDEIEDLSNPQIYWTSGVHNCGPGQRCVSKIHVVNGRVVRVTSDDSDYDFEGFYRDKEYWTDSRSLTCPKCKSYKFRVHHPGRLKYALKQTKKRGDVTGFIRINSEDALREIARKYRAIYGKYSSGAIYNIYGTSTTAASAFQACGNARTALTTYVGGSRGAYSDYSFHQYTYFQPMTGHPSILGYSASGARIGDAVPYIAGSVNNIVSWGSNSLSTNNRTSWPYIRSVELMKERCAQSGIGGKVYHISPEFVDTGVTLATDWVQVRNYTDSALIMAMFYEMIINTFDENGNIYPADSATGRPYLDVNYLDTFVYGFFDSPEYWVMTTTGAANAGTISLTSQTGTGWVKVNAVPAGRSLSAYVMGSDSRLQNALYSASANYTAQQYAAGTVTKRNMTGCSLPIQGVPAYSATPAQVAATKYKYKKDLMTPKTPEWAEAICGTPASVIRALAKMYCDPAQHPIMNEWCGGVQKQDNGVVSLFSIASLMCVTKTIGLGGEGLYGSWDSNITNSGTIVGGGSVSSSGTGNGSVSPVSRSPVPSVPSISVKEWFNAIKIGFFDELKAKGYTGSRIPNWDQTDRFVNDDGGVKTSVLWKRDAGGNMIEYTDPNDGLSYFDYVGREAGSPVYVGTRMIISHGGAIPVNQHFNTNDTVEMYKCLPIAGANPDDPDTFCLVTFDNFLSPTARFADYVLPAVSALEASSQTAIGGMSTVYRPPMVESPGESKDGWTFAYEAYKAQAELGAFSATGLDGLIYAFSPDPDGHLKYVNTSTTTREFRTAEVAWMENVDTIRRDITSRFYGMSRQQVFAEQYKPRKNQTPVPLTLSRTSLRTNLDTYLAGPMTNPFVYRGSNASVTASANTSGAGAAIAQSTSTRPNASGKLHVYNEMVVWDYERKFSKYHGWLPANRRGQKNADREGDPEIIPIPIYWHFEDCFNESYGLFDGKNTDFVGEFTLGTTHDRFRVHSSEAENPFLREMCHRTKGGGWASANDWQEYAVMPEVQNLNQPVAIPAMISSAILKKNLKTASWHELWMNAEDAAAKGIVDGDLVLAENPIGAVRVIARVSHRCIKGHVNLHQGSWYDPNPADGVDDGGCANTLMSSRPSRYDNGNSQQMAFVKITKITNF